MLYEDLPKHHAALFVHYNRKEYANIVWDMLKANSLAHVFHDVTVVDIDTARVLTRWANTPYAGEKVALISFHSITLPAQNALLKILEEPRALVKFILVTTNKESIVPTLLSRLQEQVVGKIESKNDSNAILFLVTPYAERMKLAHIISLLGAVDEEGRKDREGVRTFILSLTQILSQNKAHVRYIEEVISVASYAGDSSSSGKALLEYLSLLLPQMKT